MLKENLKYLQIAFNRPIDDVEKMIFNLPVSERIIIEVGYPLIKEYGIESIRKVKSWWESKAKRKGYIVADLKCMDRAYTEIKLAYSAGASAVTCLGLAPIETINHFIERCNEFELDSILDMINVEYPFEILSKLKKLPKIIMLHKGVDENELNSEREIQYHEIERIKNAYDNVFIAIAGGETIDDVVRAIFNGADIVVLWKEFNENPEIIQKLTYEFLKEIE